MIDGVYCTKLNIISTPGGDVLHAMKNIDNGFVDFGEAYFSEIEFNKVKAWKRHTKMTLNLVVPVGRIKFVLFDDRMAGISIQFQEIKMSRENYFRLTIPPMIWVGCIRPETDIYRFTLFHKSINIGQYLSEGLGVNLPGANWLCAMILV